MTNVKFFPTGDHAMVVEFGSIIAENINQKVHALAGWIEEKQIEGVVELLPTFRSLMIYYDCHVVSFEQLKRKVSEFDDTKVSSGAEKKKIIKVPCCYGARFGSDLHDMEKILGIDKDEIIRIHSSVCYKIYMLGFLPGFVYLGGLDKRIEVPRLSSPRAKINPGSVGIGGNQTGVYPVASPGGWRLIGGTPLDFYDPDREKPILCNAGEYIRFTPIHIDEYYDIRHLVLKGQYEPEVIYDGN
ncbi:MAG: 5-oxoprolinase subunit PxpB [Lachnospiraceae bacterium]